MNILFMGTPRFSVPSLTALVTAGHDVVGVVTRPDRPVGRGRKLTTPPVKEAAADLGLRCLQPTRVNRAEVVESLKELAPDVIVVVAFGAILKTPLLSLPPRGAINLHASLLPAYRGVAPVQWCLIHGARTTGVTTMLMDQGVDTGPTFDRRSVDVSPGETAGELLPRLAETGAGLLIDTLTGIEKDELVPVPQPTEGASYAPALHREDGYLDLNRPAPVIHNHFRGVTPAPGARIFLGEDAILVGGLRPVPGSFEAPYTVLEISGRHVRVASREGAVDLMTLRPPGKRDMDGSAFARGRRLVPGDRFAPPPVVPDLAPRVVVTP